MTSFPWRRPRHELLLLALVSAATLTLVHNISTQDISRLCLTRSLVHGHLTVDNCIGGSIDRSRYGGHLYSNKAPGMSALAIPTAEAVQLQPPSTWHTPGGRLWAVRLLTTGLAFVACAFLVGRVAEGLAPGRGGATLVTFALGTMMASFAVTDYDHIPTAFFGFAAFLLAWRGRPLLAGLAAGLAVTVEYQAAAIAVLVALYILVTRRRDLGRYVLGALPGALLVAAYDWAAFGAPWHNPLSYSENGYRGRHNSGLLGIHHPNRYAAKTVLVGEKGLLVTSPVLLAAALGLWLLWRRGLRAEAATCAAVAAVFLIAEAGYFDPYGGGSPGVRYFAPALPFLAVGLGAAFARLPWTTWGLALASIVATIPITLTWAEDPSYNTTVWRQLVRLPSEGGSSPLLTHLAGNVLVWAGPGRRLAAALVCACAAAAVVVAAGRGRLAILRR
jgi:hypothetical protein